MKKGREERPETRASVLSRLKEGLEAELGFWKGLFKRHPRAASKGAVPAQKNRPEDWEDMAHDAIRGLLHEVRQAETGDSVGSSWPESWSTVEGRETVAAYLAHSPYRTTVAGDVISDEVLQRLFRVHLRNGVELGHSTISEIAIEVLHRDLFATFVEAYTLPLGMDQGMPLGAAMTRAAHLRGEGTWDALIAAIRSWSAAESDEGKLVGLAFGEEEIQRRKSSDPTSRSTCWSLEEERARSNHEE